MFKSAPFGKRRSQGGDFEGRTVTTRDDVGNVLARFGNAVAQKDIEALVDCYEADGVVLAPNTPMVRGSSALRDLFQSDIIDAGVQAIEFDTTELVEDGSLVIEAGRNLVHVELPDGGSIANPGKYLVVFRRQADGSLKIVFDAFSSDSTPT
jgi:ketosteroid isomerase-like protein